MPAILYSSNFSDLLGSSLASTNTRSEKVSKIETVEMITHIYEANSDKIQRHSHIQSARKNLEVIRLFVRLLRDLRQVTLEKFVNINQSIEIVSKQLLAWQKSAMIVGVSPLPV